MTRRIDAVADSYTTNPWWFGAADGGTEGVWLWVDGTTPFSYSNWAPGEPNDDHPEGEDCGQLNYHPNGLWNDVNCNRQFNLICESTLPWEEFDAL